MRRVISCASLLMVLSVGCGAALEAQRDFASGEAKTTIVARSVKPAATAESAPPPMIMGMGGEMGMGGGMMMASAAPAPAQEPGQGAALPPPGAPGLSRKIIYDADIALVVEDFATTEPKVSKLVEAAGGFIAEQSLLGSPGSQRSARWKVRVPADGLESFRNELKRLGEVERDTLTSSDVTEQFYDIEARIKNKQLEEETIAQILKERSGKLEDILKVEMELSRVRGEIEQMQGRLRVLANLSSLATATIHIREREKYEPAPPVAPDFATTLSRTFWDSYNRLVETGEAIVLFFAALVWWLPFILIGLLLAWVVGRRLTRAGVQMARRAWALARTPITPPPTTP